MLIVIVIMWLNDPESLWKIIENSLVGVIIFDKNLKIKYVNRAVESTTGYKKEEICGMNAFDLVAPEHLEKIANGYRKGIEGKPVFLEICYIARNKKRKWVWGYVLPMKLGNELMGVINWIDITAYKEYQSKLKESEEFHRSLIEKSLAPVHIIQEGRIIYANESFEKLAGYRKEELYCMENLEEFIHSEDRKKVLRLYREIESGEKEAEDISFRIITGSGEVRWVTVRLVRINYQGKPAVASTALDTTETHNLANELKLKNEYLSLLNKMLRHDILNDLTVIKAAIELNDERLLKKALSKVDRISRMIYEARNLEIAGDVRREIDLAEVVREVVGNFEDVNIVLKLEEVKVFANDGIKTVVFNLVNNAIKHSGKENVEIVVETRAENGWGVLVVKDNGKGIPEELKDKIFEEGFTSGSGTGVGLFIVKKMVELYGGSIEVRDNEPSGAMFIVRLPKKFTERRA